MLQSFIVGKKNLIKTNLHSRIYLSMTLSVFIASISIMRMRAKKRTNNYEELLLIALIEGFIQFNENGFTEPSLGKLGTNFDDLKETWDSPGLSRN